MSLINKDYLLHKSGISTTMLIKLCGMFGELVPQYFDDLAQSFDHDDREKIRHYAHKSKAAFQYLGIDEGRNRLQKIEDGIWNDVPSGQLKKEFDWLQEQLPTLLEEVKSLSVELDAKA